MALSNTAVPKYYGMFRDAVIRGDIPVCREIEMEMNRIDDLIRNPGTTVPVCLIKLCHFLGTL